MLFRSVARTAASILNKPELEKKFFNMFWKGWVGLATPVASNMGTNRGLSISCYSLSPQDSTDSIMNKAHELAMLTKNGGGVGVYNIEFNAVSANGAWKVTTGAGVEVMAVGIFSA